MPWPSCGCLTFLNRMTFFGESFLANGEWKRMTFFFFFAFVGLALLALTTFGLRTGLASLLGVFRGFRVIFFLRAMLLF